MFPRCNVKQSTFTKSLQPTLVRAAESGHKTLNLICCSPSWRRGFSLLAPALLTLMAGEHSSATIRMVALKTRCVTTHSHSGYMSAFSNQTVVICKSGCSQPESDGDCLETGCLPSGDLCSHRVTESIHPEAESLTTSG